MNKYILIIFSIFFLCIPLLVKSDSTCNGVLTHSGSPVVGKCVDGSFSGYIARTGKPIYGNCQSNGQLSAYDPNTGNQVTGSCGSNVSNSKESTNCNTIRTKLATINKRLRQGYSSREGEILRAKSRQYNNALRKCR